MYWNRFLLPSGHQGLSILWWVLEQVPQTVRSPGLFCDVCWNRFLWVWLLGHQDLFVMCLGTGSHWSPGLISDVYWNRFLFPTGYQGLFVMCAGTGSFDCQVTRDKLWCLCGTGHREWEEPAAGGSVHWRYFGHAAWDADCQGARRGTQAQGTPGERHALHWATWRLHVMRREWGIHWSALLGLYPCVSPKGIWLCEWCSVCDEDTHFWMCYMTSAWLARLCEQAPFECDINRKRVSDGSVFGIWECVCFSWILTVWMVSFHKMMREWTMEVFTMGIYKYVSLHWIGLCELFPVDCCGTCLLGMD